MKAGSTPCRNERRKNREWSVRTEELARAVIREGLELHREFGPGLLEGVYETLLEIRLLGKGLQVERQRQFDVAYAGVIVPNGFRIDLLVEQTLVVELKSTEKLAPVHFKQVLTYLKILKLPLGLLVNFGAATFREGIHRVANDYRAFDDRSGKKRISRNDTM
jgi:GxxExxY protein